MKKNFTKLLLPGFGLVIPLGFLVAFFLVPVLSLISLGFFQDGTSDSFALIWQVLSRERTQRALWQTVLLAGAATLLATVLAFPLANLLYRYSFRGVALFRGLLLVPFVLPTVVVGIAFRTLFSETGWLGFLGLSDSTILVILALSFFNISVIARTVGSYWQQLSPRTAEAAASLGASPRRVFWTVTFPQLLPALSSAMSVVFLFCATAFGLVLVLGGLRINNLETEIYFLTVQLLDLPAAGVLSILQLLLTALCFYLVSARQRKFQTKTNLAVTQRLKALSIKQLPLILSSAVVGFSLALPILSLLFRSIDNPTGTGFLSYFELFSQSTFWQAVLNSFQIATASAIVAVLLAVLVAISLNRLQRFSPVFSKIVEVLFALPLGVSAVTVGFGFLITFGFLLNDSANTVILLSIGQALIALPLVLRIIAPAISRIPNRLRAAATVLGANKLRVIWDIDLKMNSRTISSAFGFAFAASIGEFGATLFLSRTETTTLPVYIYRLLSRPGAENFYLALAAAVILCLIVVLVVYLVEKIEKGVAGVF